MAIGAAGLGLKLIGGGLSFLSQRNQASAAADVTRFNASQQASDARMNFMAQNAAIEQQGLAAEIQQRQAEANYQISLAEASARDRNAKLIAMQAEARTGDSREAIRRKRVEYEKFKASQRSQIAASGVVASEGSPLELLADTAGEMEVSIQELHRGADLQRTAGLEASRMEGFAADLQRSGASSAFASASAASGLAMSRVGLDQAINRSQFGANMAQTNITRMVGMSQSRGMNKAAFGSLLSSAGSAYQGYDQYKTNQQYKPFKP